MGHSRFSDLYRTVRFDERSTCFQFFCLNGHTYGPKEHDSTVELSCTNSTDFEWLGSTGEELVWKYNKSFDFTVEWFVDFELLASTVFFLFAVFICFCSHSSRSRTERDQFVFGCFHRSTTWELRSLSTGKFYHDLTHRRFRGPVDFAIKQIGKYF